MIDAMGRKIEYLRFSLTDRCNLRCYYCRDVSSAPCDCELSAGEIVRIIHCMTSLGINKVRFTGGEPLMRRDLEEIITEVNAQKAIRDVCMTTNAHGLAARAAGLKQAGLMRLNISLDSLKKERFRQITNGGDIDQVFSGIDAALSAGLAPVKLNCVVIKGQNDDEIDDFIALAKEKPLHVRFIELMPMGGVHNDDLRIANTELLRRHPGLMPLPAQNAGQPVIEYSAPDFLGTVGFISPVTKPFCDSCNRIRVTQDGKLRPCLGDDMEVDLKEALTHNDDVLLNVIREAIYNKPKKHHFNDGFVSKRQMNRIGG